MRSVAWRARCARCGLRKKKLSRKRCLIDFVNIFSWAKRAELSLGKRARLTRSNDNVEANIWIRRRMQQLEAISKLIWFEFRIIARRFSLKIEYRTIGAVEMTLQNSQSSKRGCHCSSRLHNLQSSNYSSHTLRKANINRNGRLPKCWETVCWVLCCRSFK